ncbi:MAG: hypothetical protein HZB70_01215 [Candidatus Berkelbacteria bacterium]|nr:MAG: hypothetical protein HZB70_01215 [Candidatus Berkelbacteria bacterium]QQG52041.1 MAG: hypothetical protein HY845_01780 [Candidatus Berkelbacteria bacterium]
MGQSPTIGQSLEFPDFFYFLRFGQESSHFAVTTHLGESAMLCFRSIRDMDVYAKPFEDTPGMSRYDSDAQSIDSARDFLREHFPSFRALVLFEPGYVPGRDEARLSVHIPPPQPVIG